MVAIFNITEAWNYIFEEALKVDQNVLNYGLWQTTVQANIITDVEGDKDKGEFYSFVKVLTVMQ